MKKFLKRFKNERGLTLVELLAVIVILAIVAAIAVVAIGNVMENSRKDAHIANAQQVIASAQLFDASGEEPEDSDLTVEDLTDKGYLDSLIDPWGGEDYTFDIGKSGNEFTVTSDGTKCDFEDATKERLAEGREVLCP